MVRRNYGAITRRPDPSAEERAAGLQGRPEVRFEVDQPAEGAARPMTSSSRADTAADLVLASDDMVLPMLKWVAPKSRSVCSPTALEHRKRRQEGRRSLLSAAPAAAMPLPFALEPMAPGAPPGDGGRAPTRCFVGLESLQFAFGEVEPMFGTLALFDLEAEDQVSEVFRFNLSSHAALDLLEDGGEARRTAASMPREAVFELPSSGTAGLVLLARVEKVLEGDSARAFDTYCRPTGEDSAVDRARESAAAFCRRLGNFRMPFVWAAILVDELCAAGQGSATPGTAIELPLYAQQPDRQGADELVKALADLRRPQSQRVHLRRARQIPGALTLRGKRFGPDDALPGGTLTPSHHRPNPGSLESGARLALEVRHLPSTPPMAPHVGYSNDLYVRLRSVDLRAVTKARNIAVRVAFFEGPASGQVAPSLPPCPCDSRAGAARCTRSREQNDFMAWPPVGRSGRTCSRPSTTTSKRPAFTRRCASSCPRR